MSDMEIIKLDILAILENQDKTLYFEIPDKIVQDLYAGNNPAVQVTINNLTFLSVIKNVNKIHYLELTKKLANLTKIKIGDQVNIHLETPLEIRGLSMAKSDFQSSDQKCTVTISTEIRGTTYSTESKYFNDVMEAIRYILKFDKGKKYLLDILDLYNRYPNKEFSIIRERKNYMVKYNGKDFGERPKLNLAVNTENELYLLSLAMEQRNIRPDVVNNMQEQFSAISEEIKSIIEIIPPDVDYLDFEANVNEVDSEGKYHFLIYFNNYYSCSTLIECFQFLLKFSSGEEKIYRLLDENWRKDFNYGDWK